MNTVKRFSIGINLEKIENKGNNNHLRQKNQNIHPKEKKRINYR